MHKRSILEHDESPRFTVHNAMDPAGFLERQPGPHPRALIVLNRPITNVDIFEKAWAACEIKVFADGGANRVYDKFVDSREKYLPDYVTGDFDSLRDDVREYYENRNVKVVRNPDQYSTDFMKAAKIIEGKEHHPYDILALGAMGGRVDQEFHSIHFLYLAFEKNQTVYLISDESITFLLGVGTSIIRTPRTLLGETCGIIPVGVEAHITTSGFRWDIEDWPTRFGGQMSTSNELASDEVQVTTDQKIVFTVELRHK